MERDYFEANRQAWNLRTAVHKDSAFYDLAGFKAGKTSLNAIELEELGPVTGKRILHLQCHFGQDTLSWARLGADVTGIDLSDEAIREAEKLNQELGLNARFVCSNVYDLRENLQGAFDIVFTSYGVIGWLPDLKRWAEVIAHFLKPGGTFYMAEFHPVVWMFDEDFKKVKYPYHHTPEPIVEEQTGTYADRNAPIRYKEYSWNHGLGEVVTALLDQGLRLEHLHEFPYSPYNCFNHTVQGPDGFWRIGHLQNMIPMMYTIKCTKV